ncbi:MAG: TIGR03118 family protein [Acidobacteriota bacterium]|nr:TIGR03118 family protein [Acidobacteriota bacterium]
MLQTPQLKRSGRKLISLTLTLVLVGLGLPSFASSSAQIASKTAVQDSLIPVIAPGSAYRLTHLVSDSPGIAPVLDPLLVNPWGISMTASSPFWVANNGTSTSTLYRGDVAGAPLVKNPGLAGITIPGGLPTGTVANPSTTDFVVTSGSASGPASFLFASITGNITGWNPNVPAAGSTTAQIAASHPGHVYTGLAVANNGTSNFLYAADFANGNIDVFNGSFALQPTASFPFADPTIPTTAGNTYHPFNIQAIGSSLYVAYAKVGPSGLDEEGVGNGYVRRFNANGVRDLTFGINNGPLNSPWGVAVAPASFGIFGGALLVGNFGEGNPSIHAFNSTTGAFLGALQNEAGVGIEIPKLWALTFGNGGNGGDVNTLYFTAGIGAEEHGLFGSLKPTTASATSLIQFSTDDYAIGEGGGHIDITVTRSGNVSGSATVNYATFDQSQPNHASQKSDFQIALGTLHFAPGQTSQTFRLLLVDDLFDEGDETVILVLSNPTGAGVGLGSPNIAEVTILDNDSGAPTSNPVDETQFFVRQHYLDFLNREPDAAGLAFWTNNIEACGADAQCREVKRIDTSAAFFLAIEFQETGFLVYRTHNAAFGGRPLYGNFMRDTQALQKDFVFGAPGADAQLEANKQAYFTDFVTRPDFVTKYPATLTNEQYVDNLLASAQLSPSQVRHFVVNMTNAQEVPPANPTASGGGPRPASFGTARLTFNAAQTSMTFRSTVNNIDFTGSQTPGEANDNLTVAHIHAGAAVTPATNGPVVWGFFGTPFNDNNPNDQVVIPFATGVGGQINGKWDAPEGNNTTLAAQLSNLREGRAYVNFHTSQFGGGEVRGNIPAATALRASLVAGLNGGTETRATVLRKVAEIEELGLREFNSAFVQMEYFGYLRRQEDTAGFNFWLNKLNAFNGDFRAAEMVKAFILSAEYRQRFGAN